MLEVHGGETHTLAPDCAAFAALERNKNMPRITGFVQHLFSWCSCAFLRCAGHTDGALLSLEQCKLVRMDGPRDPLVGSEIDAVEQGWIARGEKVERLGAEPGKRVPSQIS